MNKSFLCRILAIFVSCCSLSVNYISAQESTLDDSPIESDAALFEHAGSSDLKSVDITAGAFSLREYLKEKIENAPDFIKDTKVKLNFRSMYFAQQDASDSPSNDKEKITWAAGGSLKVKSGKILDVFDISSEIFTSQHLYGPQDKDGALLLGSGQDPYTVLGVLNPQFNSGANTLTLFRQRLDLPYVNNQENRMTPNTFENYAYAYTGEGENPPIQFALGYLDKIKKRNSDEFVSMSEGAGVVDVERGMPWAGFRYKPSQSSKISLIDYYGVDFLNILYSEADYTYIISDKISLKSAIQYSTQHSVGDDLLLGTDTSSAMWGFQQSISFKKLLFRFAFTMNDDSGELRSPFGSYPGFNSGIVKDFNVAGQSSWKVGISYDFSDLLLDGLTAYADYINGNGALNSLRETLPDTSEIDLNIDYRVKKGSLDGLWPRLRSGFVNEATVGTTSDFRVIVNYEII